MVGDSSGNGAEVDTASIILIGSIVVVVLVSLAVFSTKKRGKRRRVPRVTGWVGSVGSPGRAESSRGRIYPRPRVRERESRSQRDGLAAAGRMEHKIILAVARHSPAVVVQVHVVETTQQDPAVDVGTTLVLSPVIGMVGLAVRGGAVATGPAASAVANGEGDALPGSEEAMLSSDVQRVPASVHRDGHVSAVADALVGDG